jgi:hypothetical protein
VNSVPGLLDRKHCLAVIGRTLNEHKHVDKQIFEILEIAERAQVGENSGQFSEQQFAKYILQRKYMKEESTSLRGAKWNGPPGLKRTA